MALKEIQRCAQCFSEFSPLCEIGRRRCSVHPMVPNSSSEGRDEDPEPRLWTDHYPCCSLHVPGGFCKKTCALEHSMSRGCCSSDHTAYRLMPIFRKAALDVIEVDPWGHRGVSTWISIDPLFLLRRVATIRNIDISTQEGMNTLVGGTEYAIIDDASFINAHDRRKVHLSVGPVALSIDVRNAYVYLSQKYRLPNQVVKHNFLASDSIREMEEEEVKSKRRLQDLLDHAFSAASGDTTNQVRDMNRRLACDMVELDVFGRSVRQETDKLSRSGAIQDQYYDVSEIFENRQGIMSRSETPDRESQHGSFRSSESAIDLARQITASIASSEENIAFYPFVIRTVIS